MLREAGLVDVRQDAQRRIYTLRPEALVEVDEHASGWRVHLEDLGRSLEVDGPVHAEGWSSDAGAPGRKERWEALTPTYQQMAIG